MVNDNCGSGACSIDLAVRKNEKYLLPKKMLIRAVVSFILLFSGIAFSAFNLVFFENNYIRIIWYLAAYIPVGIPVITEALESIRKKDVFSEFTLMSIATIGAFFIGEYPEAVAVMLFYAVGEIFQEMAVNRAKHSISALLDVRPETAGVVKDGKIETVRPEDVRVGQTIEVKVGERVPLDGVLLSGSASFNTSALTGESVPRAINEREEVLAGMIASDKVSQIEVTKPFSQSALARILELVQDATERKAPAEQFIRKFSRIYTPVVVLLAVLIVLLPWIWSLVSTESTFIFSDWIYRALVFLVISCPCALVISVPLGYFGGIGAASRRGILFKGSNYLEAITKINTVVMDKTGTLTRGVFEVQKIVPAEWINESELLKNIAAAEKRSTHPIAKAIEEYAIANDIVLPQADDIEEISGHGLKALIGKNEVLAGNMKLLTRYGIPFPEELVDIPETIVLCAINRKYAGYILVADTPKQDAEITIRELKELGINNLAVLSGDKQAIVTKLAVGLGVDKAYGDLLPEDKVKYVEGLKADPMNVIAFVGDGINDAPVLAISDVGVAMGGLGSDAAIETADVVIQTDQPLKIPVAIRIGKATHRIVIQNIVFALAVKLIVLILGAIGIASLWSAVFADVGVSLLAVLNSIRIMKIKF